MVVHDFNTLRTEPRPDKADSPLVVDPDAVLPVPIATQRLQSVARWRGQIAEHLRIVQLPQLALGDALPVRPDASGEPAVKQGLGIAIGEGADHADHYVRTAL